MWRAIRGTAAGALVVAITAAAGAANAQDDAGSGADAGVGADAGESAEDEELGLTPEEQAELDAAAAADSAELAPPAGAGGVGGALQSLNPDLELITDVALAWFSDDQPMQAGGHDPAANGFTLQQVELSARQTVDPYFRFDANLVFSQFGVEVEEAYATTLALPHGLQARAGQFLTRFGRINSTHPHSWDFVDQPFPLSRIFGGEGNRGVGIELSWLSPLPWYVEVLGSATDPAGEATARSFFGAEDLGLETPLDFQYTLAVKQFFELGANWSLLWGLSAATGPNPTGHDNHSDVFGTDLYLKYRPITRESTTVVSLQAEYFHRRRQVPDAVLTDHDGYAYLFWRFARRWGTAVRYEFGTAVDSDDGVDYLDPEWTGTRQRVSANLSFWPTEFSRLRMQTSGDFAPWRDEPVFAVMLALEVVVGAHGAHEF